MYVGNITEISQRTAYKIQNYLVRQSVKGLKCNPNGKPYKNSKERKRVDRVS